MRRGFLMMVWLVIPVVLLASDRRLEISLNRKWAFRIGDDPAWASDTYDHSTWDLIRPGRSWESQGYPGYDGFAWYRISFYLDETLREKALVLRLGYIDDVDRVYVNGAYVGGRGTPPPGYQSAYNQERIYNLPHERLSFGRENVIAVQVYDDEADGGLVGGRVGIYSENRLKLFQDLSGEWLFRIGDEPAWKEKNHDASDWQKVHVPATWSEYGYGDYDGYGWYRKTFIPNAALSGKSIILALGKIDDIDEVFLNGAQIGRTGRFPGELHLDRNNNYWNRERFYYIRPELIRWDSENVIAVRVFDIWQVGGIYEGPVGLLTREDYLNHKRRNVRSFGNWIQRLFQDWD